MNDRINKLISSEIRTLKESKGDKMEIQSESSLDTTPFNALDSARNIYGLVNDEQPTAEQIDAVAAIFTKGYDFGNNDGIYRGRQIVVKDIDCAFEEGAAPIEALSKMRAAVDMHRDVNEEEEVE